MGELPPLFQELFGSSSSVKPKAQSSSNGSRRKSDKDTLKDLTFDTLLGNLRRVFLAMSRVVTCLL
jgi:hypothetical protein